MKNIVIIGAGPSSLTTAYYLLKNNKDINVTILEETNQIGGISKTIDYKGNKIDIGGHRFFTKDEEVMKLWLDLMPLQGQPAKDYKKLDIDMKLPNNNINPDKEDDVFLKRRRVSRILYEGKFYDYPVSLSFKTIKNFGIIKTMKCGFSYLKSIIIKKKETNLENFYINRFGKELYSTFFEHYTEKVWGRSPKEISALWGSQRVKGISIKEIIKNLFKKSKETSLIEEFYYPKFGPGSLYEKEAKEIEKLGGKIIFNSKVNKIHKINNKIDYIIVNNKRIKCDILVSSMPIKDLFESLNDTPKKIKKIAKNLPYRDFITVGLLVNNLNLKNNTNLKTINDIIPDTWLYIQEKSVKLGRVQIFNNWSPYLINDENKVWLGLEYFCNENDEFWNKLDKDIIKLAIEEITKINFLNKEDIIDSTVIRIKKAYPAYFDSYSEFSEIERYLNKIKNLYPIGRNGQHHYNNMDHSIKTGIIAANLILNNKENKEELWKVNTDKEYHENKQS